MAYESKRLKEDKRNKKISTVLLVLVMIALVATLVIFFTVSKYSKLNRITVSGLKNTEDPKDFIQLMKAQADQGSLAKVLGLDNYFAWSKQIEYKNPQYKKITLEKNIADRSINFFVQLKERYAIWCKVEIESQMENCRWIDSEGVAFEPAPKTSGQIIPSISEEVKLADFSANSQIMTSSHFNYVKDILMAFKELEIQKESTFLRRSLQELHIQTVDGTNVIFSLRFDPKETALPALQKFNSDTGLNFFSEINLAVEGRAFTTVK